MKIGILTHELHNNYGGTLQNYALQQALKKLGHEPVTMDYKSMPPAKQKVRSIIKRTILRYIFRKKIRIFVHPSKEQAKQISQHTRGFVDKYINTTSRVYLNQIATFKNDFDAVIVGSDQVWRPNYLHKNIDEMFLKSFPNSIPKIAYAASFGVDYWEFTDEQTRICKELAQYFKAISVREASGVSLCKKYLNVDAVHVLDPTMLLNKEDYIKLIEQEKTPSPGTGIMTYVLDKSPEKDAIIQAVSQQLRLPSFSVMPQSSFANSTCIEDCVYPPITSWLRGFMDADFVVTDSFHGTVFAIIFNKPFISIGNKARGLDRFTSLLETFHLENRLITSFKEFSDDLVTSFTFSTVNQIRNEKKEKAYSFLQLSATKN